MYRYFEKGIIPFIKPQSLYIKTIQGYLYWTDKKVKTKNTWLFLKINSMFQTAVHAPFSTCHMLKTWFELLRV